MSESTYSENSNISLPAAGAILPFLAVKVNSSGQAALAGASDIPVGFTTEYSNALVAGDAASVHIIGKGGTCKAIQAGAIPLGSAVYAAASGQIQAAPNAPTAGAVYYRLGVKISPDEGAADDVVEIIDMQPVPVVLNPLTVNGEMISEDIFTPFNATGADASGAPVDLTAAGVTADMRIAFVIDITDGTALDKSLFTPGADKFTQASGNYAAKKLIFITLPAAI
jgi:hypothetical protein